VIVDLNYLEAHGEMEYVKGMAVVLAQKKDMINKRGGRFALLWLGSKRIPVTATTPLIPGQGMGEIVSD
jgi:hypothetical protein